MPCTANTKSCTVCYFRRRPLLTLRGFCAGSTFDTQYILVDTHYRGNKPVIKGYFHTTISWMESKNSGTDDSNEIGSWQIRTQVNNSSYGQLTSRNENTYPVGRREWQVRQDPCSSGESSVRNLTLTSCKVGQYTCDSGDCIPVANVNYFFPINCIRFYFQIGRASCREQGFWYGSG